MKRGKLVVVLFMFVSLFLVNFVSGLTSITNCVELQAMENNLNENYILANDIDCTFDTQNPSGALYNAGKGFMPIGIYVNEITNTPFRGSFDGQNHIINGLKIVRNDRSSVGLFGFAWQGGPIKNVGLKNVDILGISNVGALAGYSRVAIEQTYSSGNVRGTSTNVGGLVGLFGTDNSGGSVLMTKSYSHADVIGTDQVGGLVGYSNFNGIMSFSYSNGSVSGSSNTGGFVGLLQGSSVSNSYWDIQTSGQGGSAGGNGIPLTSDMKKQSTYSGWDFTNTWNINEGTSYPFFQWQTSPIPPPSSTCDNGGIAITNCVELQNINNNLDSDYCLVNDIDCSDTVNWNGGAGFEPIGDVISGWANTFKNEFDGQGNLITDLYINRPSTDRVGLFETVCHSSFCGTTGIIKNVGLNNVDITGRIIVGPLVGLNWGGVFQSYANGNVVATCGGNDCAVGGLVGGNSNTVEDSYSQTVVVGSGNVNGGLVGQLHTGAVITNSYSTESVTGASWTGGLVGDNWKNKGGPVTSSYWDKENSGNTASAVGTGIDTTAEMFQQATFIGWDFTNTWNIEEDIDYPRLQWETFSNPPPPPPPAEECGNGICAVGENCPADAVGCIDNTCYEATCTNGCGEIPVANGESDETCLDCDGSGTCTTPYPSCTDDLRIMRLFSDTNSHGALYNELGYLYEICYDDLFPSGTYVPDGTEHNCVSNNKVLGLFSNANSVAEIPENSNLPVNVCYGDLSCNSRDVGVRCDAGDREVLRLYSNTNSHIAIAGTAGYDTLICCTSGTISPPSTIDRFWSDMNEERLVITGDPDKGRAEIGDTVLLIYKNSGGVEGDIVSFVVKEDDISFFGEDSLDDNIRTINGRVDENGRAVALWKITQEDYNKGNVGGGVLEGNDEEFYFNVAGDKSNILLVAKNTDDDSPPTSTIDEPINRGIYLVNEPIEFKQSTKDSDSVYRFEWNLGDGTIITGDSIINEFENLTHSFTTSGQKNIVLTVRDDKTTIRKRTSILVVGSPNVLAYIDSPSWNQIFTDYNIPFDAKTGSFVVDTVFDDVAKTITAECLAGICPEFFVPCKQDYTPCPISTNNYNSADSNFIDFKFNWSFDTNGDGKAEITQENIGPNGAMENRNLPINGGYNSILNISGPVSAVDDGERTSGINSVQFSINADPTGYICKFNTLWEHTSGNVINSVNNCFHPDSPTDNSMGICCPENKPLCVLNPSTNKGECKATTNFCGQFLNENSCNSVALNDVALVESLKNNPDFVCDTINNNYCGGSGIESIYKDIYEEEICKCGWENTLSKCAATSSRKIIAFASSSHPTQSENYRFEIINDEDPLLGGLCMSGSNNEPAGTCYTITSNIEDNCQISGVETITLETSWEGSGTPPSECVEGISTVSIACDNIVKLPFFGSMQFLISLIGIALIYLVLIFRKKSWK